MMQHEDKHMMGSIMWSMSMMNEEHILRMTEEGVCLRNILVSTRSMSLRLRGA
jgi:hypothetical protein